MNIAGLLNAGNYVLALPVGLGLSPLTPTNIAAVGGSNGQVFATVTYNNGKALKTGNYVVTLHAAGLTDLAGNMLNEQHFVTFPQAGNSPNPDYVSQVNVSRSLVAAAPVAYVSLAEQRAAAGYTTLVQGKKVVRVPQLQTSKVTATKVPRRRPSFTRPPSRPRRSNKRRTTRTHVCDRLPKPAPPRGAGFFYGLDGGASGLSGQRPPRRRAGVSAWRGRRRRPSPSPSPGALTRATGGRPRRASCRGAG